MSGSKALSLETLKSKLDEIEETIDTVTSDIRVMDGRVSDVEVTAEDNESNVADLQNDVEGIEAVDEVSLYRDVALLEDRVTSISHTLLMVLNPLVKQMKDLDNRVDRLEQADEDYTVDMIDSERALQMDGEE